MEIDDDGITINGQFISHELIEDQLYANSFTGMKRAIGRALLVEADRAFGVISQELWEYDNQTLAQLRQRLETPLAWIDKK